MTTVLFVGPSLTQADLAGLDGFELRPPVAQGDVFEAARISPVAMGIIDGYFHGVPAVWHKEILWAMDQGIHVFGAASMGALRAAELHSFGMRGIGRIFEDFRDGVLSDDDEVAVLHGPREAGFVTVTEPMVNVRATMARAVEGGVVSDGEAARVLELAKGQYYEERTWETILTAAGSGAFDIPVSGLRDWLATGRVDQKRSDALELVGAMRAFVASDPDRAAVDYTFEFTEMWAGAPWNDTARQGGGPEASRDFEGILDELRLEGDAWFERQARAVDAALDRGEIEPSTESADRDAVMAELNAFRRRHGLGRRSDVEAWARDNGMDLAGVEQMVTEQANRRLLVRGNAGRFNQLILEQLMQDAAEYERLSRRSDHKAKVLGSAAGATAEAASLSDSLLFEWYFRDRLGRDVPQRPDDYARDLGLAGRRQLAALLQDEADYLKILSETENG